VAADRAAQERVEEAEPAVVELASGADQACGIQAVCRAEAGLAAEELEVDPVEVGPAEAVSELDLAAEVGRDSAGVVVWVEAEPGLAELVSGVVPVVEEAEPGLAE
jgi:hypothetical protein